MMMMIKSVSNSTKQSVFKTINNKKPLVLTTRSFGSTIKTADSLSLKSTTTTTSSSLQSFKISRFSQRYPLSSSSSSLLQHNNNNQCTRGGHQQQINYFSTSSKCLSNIGSTPIVIPAGVEITIQDKPFDAITLSRMEINSKRRGKIPINLTKTATITGPRGELKVDLADFIKVDFETLGNNKSEEQKQQQETSTSTKAIISVVNKDIKTQKSMWGTTRSLLYNGVLGVSEGHISIIKFVGTGFRAALEKVPSSSSSSSSNNDETKEIISLKVGYCVPIKVDIPEGIKIQTPLPHRMIIEGNDKQQVKLLAAEIRKHRKPEPYKGKGIFVDGETIKLKARKVK